jgi:hypothetical protein
MTPSHVEWGLQQDLSQRAMPLGTFREQSERKIAPPREARSEVGHSRIGQGKKGDGERSRIALPMGAHPKSRDPARPGAGERRCGDTKK